MRCIRFDRYNRKLISNKYNININFFPGSGWLYGSRENCKVSIKSPDKSLWFVCHFINGKEDGVMHYIKDRKIKSDVYEEGNKLKYYCIKTDSYLIIDIYKE
jgi:hypothetical protein